MDRKNRIKLIEAKLDRPIVWYGPRGTDAVGLNVFPDFFSGSFTLYDKFPYSWADEDKDNFFSLEELTHRRKLSREYGIDADERAGEQEFRRRVGKALEDLSPYVVAYRADHFINAAITRSRDAVLLGNDVHTFERASMKPRVERELKKRNVPMIPWETLSRVEDVDPYFDAHHGVVVRPHSGSSGVGILKLTAGDFSDESRDIVRTLLESPESVVSIAPYLANSISLNMSGVVYKPRSSTKPCDVSRFPCASQIIGAPALTDLPFGYCGNDFAYGYSLDDNILDEADHITRLVGEYLGSTGYAGAFGVDLLVTNQGDLLFTEVNPRFQGSTRILTRMTSTANMADVLVEHLAATLGIKFAGTLTAREWTENNFQPWTQMYLHSKNINPIVTRTLNPQPLPGMFRTNERSSSNTPVNQNVLREMVAPPYVSIGYGAVLERISMRGGATLDGITLSDRAIDLINHANSLYMPFDTPAIEPGPQNILARELNR